MTFLWPPMLFALLAIPLLVLLYLRVQRRRAQIRARYGTLGLVQAQAGRPLGRRRHLPAVIFLVGLTVLLVALARPRAIVNLPRLEGTIILAFDVSGSMAADDLAPTRMEAAKAAALAFAERQPPSVRIGVVTFSDAGFAAQVPTHQQDLVAAAINRLKPERGTSVGQGILLALNTLFTEEAAADAPVYSDRSPTPTPAATVTPPPVPPGSNQAAVIVMLTDGENTAPPDPFEAAMAAANLGVRIYPIGIGSPAGTTLTVNGFTVHTRLDEPTLQQIAEMTEGDYYNAANEAELRAIYESLQPELVIRAEPMEVTAFFAGGGLLALLIGGALSLVWLGRVP